MKPLNRFRLLLLAIALVLVASGEGVWQIPAHSLKHAKAELVDGSWTVVGHPSGNPWTDVAVYRNGVRQAYENKDFVIELGGAAGIMTIAVVPVGDPWKPTDFVLVEWVD